MTPSRDPYPDHAPAGLVRTVLRVLMLLVFIGLGVLGFARGEWFVLVFMLLGVAGVASALRTGKGPKRLEGR